MCVFYHFILLILSFPSRANKLSLFRRNMCPSQKWRLLYDRVMGRTRQSFVETSKWREELLKQDKSADQDLGVNQASCDNIACFLES
jgi:hypothetical protein